MLCSGDTFLSFMMLSNCFEGAILVNPPVLAGISPYWRGRCPLRTALRSWLSASRSSALVPAYSPLLRSEPRPLAPNLRCSTSSSATRSKSSGSTTARVSRMTASLISMSRGVSTDIEGLELTSISHGLRCESMRMSNPKSSKELVWWGMQCCTAKRLRRITSEMRDHSPAVSMPSCAGGKQREGAKARHPSVRGAGGEDWQGAAEIVRHPAGAGGHRGRARGGARRTRRSSAKRRPVEILDPPSSQGSPAASSDTAPSASGGGTRTGPARCFWTEALVRWMNMLSMLLSCREKRSIENRANPLS
mmetsp:Transcript_39370/g.125609  ORF Transcript_39370/g.125609 Transcript_39370/m.125609 type:complete len:305 (+) Transcript_39370:413-1327(+)